MASRAPQLPRPRQKQTANNSVMVVKLDDDMSRKLDKVAKKFASHVAAVDLPDDVKIVIIITPTPAEAT